MWCQQRCFISQIKMLGEGGGPRLSWLLGLLQVSQISRLLTRRLQCDRDTMRLNHFIPNFSELRRQIPARFFQFLPTEVELIKILICYRRLYLDLQGEFALLIM